MVFHLPNVSNISFKKINMGMRGEMLKKEFFLVHFGQIFVHDGPVGGGGGDETV